MTPPELANIIELEKQLAQQAAVIEQMREALQAMVICARDEGKGLRIADEALALQPCPEVLNKVRADAMKQFAKAMCTYGYVVEDYIKTVEKGEA